MSQRYCRKCLMSDMGEDAYFQELSAYIARISPDEKVSDELYQERLAICRSCEELISGMCRLCGCYVELRAAMKVQSCPHVPAKWTKSVREDEW